VRHYFVTGGTGVVGTALVPALLADPAHEVSLLIRADDAGALQQRVDGLFAFWALGGGEPDARRRLHALRGDATEPQLGLSPADHSAVLTRTTHIVHAAGAVRMNLPLEDARHSAVGSAQQVLDLAWLLQRAGRLQKVEFVSTVGVGGRLPVVPEDWIDTPRGFHNTYEQSKAEAEDLVRAAVAQGLPLTVHRPSMVVGDSRSGRIVHFQVFYHLCEFLSGRRTHGLFPPLGDARLDIVPADYVTGVIAWASGRAELAGRVLHTACGADSLRVDALRGAVRALWAARGAALPPVRTVPASVFRAMIRGAGLFADERTRRALRTLPIFLDYLATNQLFVAERTDALVSQAGGIRRPPTPEVLDKVLGYYLDRQ
jgi:thioester reductase-like protein